MIDFFVESACKNCNYYLSETEICAGELLPIDRAIMRSIQGRGLCKKIKDIDEKLREGRQIQ